MSLKQKVLVLGIGNDILTDDGIGPRIVQQLEKEKLPSLFAFQTATVGGLEILEMVTGFREIVFIDAIKTRDGIPGSIYYLTPENFRETLHLTNLHDINFLNALKLGEKLGMELPEKIRILAIEIVEDMEFSEQFSPSIREKFPEILEEVREYLSRISD
ncbi:MAG: hydrogenase maturation protease [Bacteroidetes bacterium]|nr:MAG: hydrogenase maturation protease [Bacteroidota bacterium]